MELTLGNGFIEMNEKETVSTDGGSFVGGLIAGFLVDGLVKAVTGKSCADWVADTIIYIHDSLFLIECY